MPFFYFPPNSRFTISLTCLPSTRMPPAAKRAIAFFMTAPISFIVGEPITLPRSMPYQEATERVRQAMIETG